MLDIIKSIVWSVATILLIFCGLYYSRVLKFIQFNFIGLFKSFKKEKTDKISPFKALMMSLAAKIGVGSLAGVALAIYAGGPGTVLWMWIISIITSVNSFVESILGIKYRVNDKKLYMGGPSYYISKGLNSSKLAILYSILIIFTFTIGFNTIQANTIMKMVVQQYNISPLIIGLCIACATAFVIFKNNNYITDFVGKFVPIMAIFYFLISIYIILKNYILLPKIFYLILNSALNLKAFGFSLIITLIIGIQRGIFNSEAGTGTSAIAAGMSDSNSSNRVGYMQMFGVNFTTFVVCTCTAFIILLSDYDRFIFTDVNGIEITTYAFKYHLGSYGGLILLILIILFAFSTIISGYYFSETNIKYFYPQISGKNIFLFKLITVLLIIFGSTSNATLLWYIADILIAMLCIINVYSLLKLRNQVKRIFNDISK